MAKPLRSQLNQIRAWVRQGRTDAWIAHQLEVSTSELREFRRRHELSAEEDSGEEDLRDEIEAEIEATMAAEEEEDDEPDEDADESDEDKDSDDGEERAERPKRRRRRRRGGRGKRAGASMQASFDHGEEGYGLWLDPSIADDPVYTQHWADHRAVEVTVEPDRIVITRANNDGSGTSDDSDSSDSD
jgi:hypothetical protein